MLNYLFFLIPLIILITNFIFKKKLFLCSYTGNKHQKFANIENIPLTGGIFFYLFILLFFFDELFSYHIFLFLIFLIGIFSDLNSIKSANKRFLLQAFTVLICVVFNQMSIQNTGIDLLDKILFYKVFNYIFLTFCILVIINGSNFIDGLNTLTIGYYISLIFIIFKLDLFQIIGFETFKIIYLLFILVFIFFINFLNKMFLGDSGSYLFGSLVALNTIVTDNLNSNVSSFFLCILLSYLFFEVFFSFMRKIYQKKSPVLPDNEHLHMLSYIKVSKIFGIDKGNYLNSIIINSIFSVLVLPSLYFADNGSVCKYWFFILILIYTSVYIRLYRLTKN
mgnify:CR=1 FL=1